MMPHRGLKVLGICLFPIWIFSFGSPLCEKQVLKREGPARTIVIQAAGRGYPWVNFAAGRSLEVRFAEDSDGAARFEELQAAGLVEPLSLAAGDFDEDGVPDLVCGYGAAGGGVVTLHGGNVDSIFPNSPEAWQRKRAGTFTPEPFFAPRQLLELSEAPEFLATGNFDFDSNLDIVAASRRSSTLYLYPGNGLGGFTEVQMVPIPGLPTALVAGEVNRRDGLQDLVVGVVTDEGPRLLVFESLKGALRDEPEVFDLPFAATDFAIGHLDGNYPLDLAVAAGQQLMIVHGRDRRLYLDEERRGNVPAAEVERYSYSRTIHSLAIGKFSDPWHPQIALLFDDGSVRLMERSEETSTQTFREADDFRLPIGAAALTSASSSSLQLITARVSSIPQDDLIVVDRGTRQLHVLFGFGDEGGRRPAAVLSPAPRLASLDMVGAPVAVLPMRLNEDALSDLVVLNSHPNPLGVL
ncbi:MAG: FG-GAP repeat domain-containing protein, partial [Acidobacteriota bacterium]